MEKKKEEISFEFNHYGKKNIYLSIVLIPILLFVIVFHPRAGVKSISICILIYNIIYGAVNILKGYKQEMSCISFSEEGITWRTVVDNTFYSWESISEVYYSNSYGREFLLIPLHGSLNLKNRTTIRDRFYFETNLVGLIINRVIHQDVIRLCGKYCEPRDDWKRLVLFLKDKTHFVVDR